MDAADGGVLVRAMTARAVRIMSYRQHCRCCWQLCCICFVEDESARLGGEGYGSWFFSVAE